MPDGVVELPPLVTVDPHWASKLSDPSIQQGVRHSDSFLVRNCTCRTVPTEPVLHGDDVPHAIMCCWHRSHQVDVQHLAGEPVFPRLVLADFQVHLLDLGQASVTLLDLLLQL